MNLNECKSCKIVIDHEIRIINAYINNKPHYSQYCKNCTRKYWMDFKIISGTMDIKGE